jgi:uroporphyrinogen-III synthase
MDKTMPLTGKNVLITRPLGREENLRRLIEQAGGSVLHYPAFKIQAPSDIEVKSLTRIRDQLHSFSMAIFISATAVEQSQIYFPVLPEHLSIVSIGSKTTQALNLQNIHTDIEAPEHNTESLLQSPHLQAPNIQGQRILIFRGDGGRAHLGDTLVRRGAQVRYVETYHRKIPPLPPLTEQQIDTLDAVTISSNEGLDNLVTLMEDPSLLIDVPLIVPGKRAASLAKQHGFKVIIAADNATDEATFTALSKLLSTTD